MVAAFRATLDNQPDGVALRDSTGSVRLTWAECGAQVERLAGGLAALGVGAGDTVALMLRNSPLQYLLDTAAQHLGAVPWSVYLTSSPEQIRFQLAVAGTRVVVCESDLLPRLAQALPGTEVVHVISANDLHTLPEPPSGSTWRRTVPRCGLTGR